MLALADRWGRRDVFAADIAVITAQLRATLADASAEPDKRLAAGKGLVSIDDGMPTIEAILKQINVQAPPELQIALLRAVADSKDAAAGTEIISHYKSFTPASQRTALSILLRKYAWARQVLQAVESGGISGADLKPEDWQLLTRSDDAQLAELAKKLEKSTGRAPTADRKQIVEKLMPLAAKPGDVTRGRVVFEQNCMVCHTVQGKGGQVGPDLTGIGHKPKSENLIDILDPNRSVEGTYRAWNVVMKDGNTFYGRLAKESRTSVEIIDTTGSHVLQRGDIKSISGTDRSIMPDGFEALPPDDLCAILEYLAQADVKR
jgi:putative heme-binding domain-containing protein